MIRATLSAWATSLAKEPRTLLRILHKAGFKTSPRQKITAADIFTALTQGELELKRRLLAAQAQEKERENAEAERQLVRIRDVEKIITEKIIIPLRQLLISAPTTLDILTNPDHPDIARTALNQWRDQTLSQLRTSLDPASSTLSPTLSATSSIPPEVPLTKVVDEGGSDPPVTKRNPKK